MAIKMNERFFDLAREKQDRMINGAIEVFAKNGYKHASTDDMVRTAGVSKGLWFHYFGSKEGIYVFAYDYCVKYMLLELSTAVNADEHDYFEILRQISMVKVKAGKNYPYLSSFIEGASCENERGLVEKTADSRRAYDERVGALMRAAEIGNVPDRAKCGRIKKMMEYTVNGIMRERTMEAADPDTVYREIKAYIDLVSDMVQNFPPSVI